MAGSAAGRGGAADEGVKPPMGGAVGAGGTAATGIGSPGGGGRAT